MQLPETSSSWGTAGQTGNQSERDASAAGTRMFCEEQSPSCPLSGQPRVSHFFPPLFQSALKFLEEGRQNSEIAGGHWRYKKNRAMALSPEPASPGLVLAEPGQKGPPSRRLPSPFPHALSQATNQESFPSGSHSLTPFASFPIFCQPLVLVLFYYPS